MSKLDNTIRMWTGTTNSPLVAHWYSDGEEWVYCSKGHITPGETFCLSAEDDPPDGVGTDSLDGLECVRFDEPASFSEQCDADEMAMMEEAEERARQD